MGGQILTLLPIEAVLNTKPFLAGLFERCIGKVRSVLVIHL